MKDQPAILPGYTMPEIKRRLLEAGASGTVYALVMPEIEEAVSHVMDGGDAWQMARADGTVSVEKLLAMRERNLLDRYREPWSQKQDAMHREWFDMWTEWAAPIAKFDTRAFSHRYPTAGASEGIMKVMAERAMADLRMGRCPVIHVFEGEYEGFTAFADALSLQVIRHPRDQWRAAAVTGGSGQFWISQPSAIDGMVWPHFDEFARTLALRSPEIELIPDLSYVGAVAREFEVVLDIPNIRCFVVSQSKPFGAYYHRIGGVFSRDPLGTLVGNIWFKNLQSLAIGCEMMRRHDVFDLPRRYRAKQEEAARRIGTRLAIDGIEVADVFVIGHAPIPSALTDIQSALVRGSNAEARIRVCLTPEMTMLVDPAMAPMLGRIMAGAENAEAES